MTPRHFLRSSALLATMGALALAADGCASAPPPAAQAPKPAPAPAARPAQRRAVKPEEAKMAPIPNPPEDAKPARAPAPKAAPKPAAPKAAPAKPTPSPAAANPARAAKLRASGLEQLNRGAIDKAVALLQQALQLDPDNELIQRDLERAQRISQAVHAKP